MYVSLPFFGFAGGATSWITRLATRQLGRVERDRQAETFILADALGFVVPAPQMTTFLVQAMSDSADRANYEVTLSFVTPTTYQKAQRLAQQPVP